MQIDVESTSKSPKSCERFFYSSSKNGQFHTGANYNFSVSLILPIKEGTSSFREQFPSCEQQPVGGETNGTGFHGGLVPHANLPGIQRIHSPQLISA